MSKCNGTNRTIYPVEYCYCEDCEAKRLEGFARSQRVQAGSSSSRQTKS